MKRFLLDEIERYSQEAGGKHKLSIKIGKSYTYVEMILKRDAFSAIERLWKEILAEKEEKIKELESIIDELKLATCI